MNSSGEVIFLSRKKIGCRPVIFGPIMGPILLEGMWSNEVNPVSAYLEQNHQIYQNHLYNLSYFELLNSTYIQLFQQHVDGKVKFVFKQVAVVENFFDIIYRYVVPCSACHAFNSSPLSPSSSSPSSSSSSLSLSSLQRAR